MLTTPMSCGHQHRQLTWQQAGCKCECECVSCVCALPQNAFLLFVVVAVVVSTVAAVVALVLLLQLPPAEKSRRSSSRSGRRSLCMDDGSLHKLVNVVSSRGMRTSSRRLEMCVARALSRVHSGHGCIPRVPKVHELAWKETGQLARLAGANLVELINGSQGRASLSQATPH